MPTSPGSTMLLSKAGLVDRAPSLTPESIELWRQYTEELVAAQSGE